MVWLALLQGALLVSAPSAPLIALGMWWNSNTISHNFVHRPFFRRKKSNALFAAYLSVLLGIPQAWWRQRHLAHHGIEDKRGLHRSELALQIALVLGSWAVLSVYAPLFFFGVYMPGYAAGLALCALHGHFEHANGTISHYGALYNLLCFNDGYHIEHHRHPGVSWARLPQYRMASAVESAWPAPLRWIEACSLTSLERLALRSHAVQQFMVRTHTSALRALNPFESGDRIAIIGGGLFPRTALALRSVVPDAHVTVIDANREHLECARRLLNDDRISFVHAVYDGASSATGCDGCDAIVIPLAFHGNRKALYERPPAHTLVIHDWIWRKRGSSRVVSPILLKRINVITR